MDKIKHKDIYSKNLNDFRTTEDIGKIDKNTSSYSNLYRPNFYNDYKFLEKDQLEFDKYKYNQTESNHNIDSKDIKNEEINIRDQHLNI